jgi:Ca-activated chloride channel family protein
MLSNEFFFLRPYWLLLVIPALWLVWLAMRGNKRGIDTAWSRLVDPHLLAALSVSKARGARSRWLPAVLGAGLLAATVAMAGPTWRKIELPSYQSKQPVVVVMSLAQSMNADDIKPSRLVRAGHKLRDILQRQDGGDVGFVIYSDRPFTAAPLTEDGEVIRQMLPELSTGLMPVLGNRADLAITRARDLLKNAGAAGGNIILLADSPGSNAAASNAAAQAARAAGYKVDVIGIGTDKGATLRTASGEPITGENSAAMRAPFDANGLRRVAAAGGGVYAPLTANNSDVKSVLPQSAFDQASVTTKQVNFKADGWADMGYWLLLVPVLLAPLAFRRNVVLVLPLALVLMAGLPPGRAEAATFDNLWKTPDQQGATAFADRNYAAAAQKFEDNRWRAASLYRGGDYATAARTLADGAMVDDAYNRGNALAKSGDLEGALGAYDKALKLQPGDADARFNRDLVAKLLEQQKQQQQKQQQQKQQQGGQGQDQKQANQQQQKGGQGQDQKQANQQQQKGGQGQDQKQANQQQQKGGQKGQDQKQANQQQQKGGQKGQDQKQADQQQQKDGQKGQDQKQANQQQQQRGGQKGQDQKQANQQQQQKGGQKGQDQKQADRQHQKGHQGQNQQQPGSQEQTPAQARAQDGAAERKEKSAFRKAMDELLKGNAGDQAKPKDAGKRPKAAASSRGITEKEQANEQMLRSVPDDASGLLRARIRQYYARIR